MKNTNWAKFGVSVVGIAVATLTAVAGSDALGLSEHARANINATVGALTGITMFFVNPNNKAAAVASLGTAISRFTTPAVPANRLIKDPAAITVPVTTVPGLVAGVDPVKLAETLEAIAASTRQADQNAKTEAQKQATLAQAADLEAQAKVLRDGIAAGQLT